MELTWEQFQKAYQEASDEVKGVIDSDTIPKLAHEYLEAHSETKKEAPEIIRLISHYVLGNIDSTIVESQLPGIASYVERIPLTKLHIKTPPSQIKAPPKPSASVPEANNELKERLELRPEGAPTQKPASVEPPQEGAMKPLTRDEVLQALSPKRTMQSDISSIKVDDSEE